MDFLIDKKYQTFREKKQIEKKKKKKIIWESLKHRLLGKG